MRLLLSLTALAAAAHPALAGEPARPPNVLFIVSDDLNCDLGCYGHMVVKSPNLDRLAATGVRFDRAYIQYPVCNPSRTSFLTGLRPTTTRVMDNATHFRRPLPDAVTLPELFRKNGYESIGLGKVFHRGLSPDDTKKEMDDPRSFDRVLYGQTTAAGNKGDGRNLTGGTLAWCRWLAAEGADGEQADGQLADEAVKVLGEKRDKPLFLAVGFYRPHDPFQSPKKYFELYDSSKFDLPKSPEGYKPPYPLSLAGGALAVAFDGFTDKERREFLHAYYAGISFMDAQVGRLLDALDKNKLSDNTIVVFLGDHGYELGVRNWWNKNTLFERSCRTPLIVRAPGAKGNGTPSAALAEFIDLYPTLADLCALKDVPKELEGASLRGLLGDPSRKHKDAALTVVKRGPVLGRSVRTERYRYTEWDGGSKGAELYDHATDPGEWVNLADKPEMAKTRAELSALIKTTEAGAKR
ncbi:iduronate-2-sulfatase : Sulfatase OS=Dyadobacter fermentans (strain ATCC 700827 / DSM 18053 / NS114) GN=Dfer_2051 PE=4 SV=1: Sulfatase [Gemmataceae bacterium]|nr:iduronate-2-sulfatase : Sulfatase OS=Dyadobacter fermentans (strain ATCC 700827 / DSM 18053 / NS114) GN=Dfer_2051 PE=4 SV=1: Sulfatase [Gemmataceae bacterium]VTT99783.1 iduronate-2-sulfatase : Sulfatase OS=Dyadobacter fermentans (strain ATCC 700827 / DSM 18053 / NS114) GN=Dfer_2051 PE=4 SV=1: Sulfatase [Gemmataceae bacterium]